MPDPFHETKFSGANGDREILIFSVQLTMGRIDNLARLILGLAICDDHTYYMEWPSYTRQKDPPHASPT